MQKLEKSLGLLDVFSIASGAMISSGIFILPGIAFGYAGPSMVASYFLAGILALAGIMSIIELSTAMPMAGGDYYFVTRTLGLFAGTVSGFLSWIALVLKTAFAVFGLSEIVYLLTGYSLAGISPVLFYSLIFTVFFVVLNIAGVKKAAKLEVLLVIFLILIMVLYILLGLDKVRISNFEPFIIPGKGINTLFSTIGFVFVSFGGLLKVASISEEVRNPERNIPAGMISSIVVITVLYSLLLVVAVGTLPAENLKASMSPIADSARAFAGKPGYVFITIAALLAFVTTANAGIMSASRYPLALSRDSLMPAFINRVGKVTGTPYVSIILTGVLIVLALFLPLETLVKAASAVILTSYVLSNLSVIILRESGIQNYRPTFKTPFYPWLQIFSSLVFVFLIIDMGLQAVEVSAGLILVSIGLYLFYGRKARGEYALLHLIERITDRKLTSRGLEEELKDIIRKRDDIIKDDFDELIENAAVADMENAAEPEDLFGTVSQTLSSELSISSSKLLSLLHEREKESSTAISPFVAIPHIIAEGENIFKIMLVRCSEGIRFSDDFDSVKAVFVIIGSRDRRNLHLKSLAAIAQIVQNQNFEKRWLAARDVKDLRDILLMGKRKRS